MIIYVYSYYKFDFCDYQLLVVRHPGDEVCKLIVVKGVWPEELLGELVEPPGHDQVPE